MKTNKAYKFRIYPTESQIAYFTMCFGHTRFLYNKLLQEKNDAYKNNGISIKKNESQVRITELKHTKEFLWLKQVNSQTLQGANHDLFAAFDRFFNKKLKNGYPKFKKKNIGSKSFSVPQHFSIDPKNNEINIPILKNGIKTKFHQSLKGVSKFNNLTISMTPTGKFFVSINVEEEIKTKKPITRITKRTKKVGIDLGIKDFIVEDNGRKTENPKFLSKSENRFKSAQRKLSKKIKGSKNKNKARIKLARLHEKVKNQRNDFLHKTSSRLVSENQVIFLEDLNVKGMMKNRHLSKAISDVSWSEFVRQLKYKSEWAGAQIVQIGRFEPSSKLCSTIGCNYVNHDLKLSDREWTCPECGITHDRDINAAKNVVNIGMDSAKFKSVEKSTAVTSKKKKQVGSLKQKSLAPAV